MPAAAGMAAQAAQQAIGQYLIVFCNEDAHRYVS